jgi:hypothetical protein
MQPISAGDCATIARLHDDLSPTTENAMAVETPSLFARVIQDHLELKRQNADLEPQMPIDRYRAEDPFDNHPLFKTEEQARFEETMDGEQAIDTTMLAWPGEETLAHAAAAPIEDSGLWSRSRDFDWGD